MSVVKVPPVLLLALGACASEDRVPGANVATADLRLQHASVYLSITHLQLIDPDDVLRFRDLGVIANFQALWANSDDYLTSLTEPALGPQRSLWLYPIASGVESGAVVSGGSD